MGTKKRKLSDAQYQKMYGTQRKSSETGSSSKSQSSSSSSGRNKGEMTGSSYSSRTYSTPSKSTSQMDNDRGERRTARTNVQKQQSYTPTRTNTVHGRNDSDINRYNRITGSSSTAQNSANRNVGMNRTQGSSSNTDRTSAGTATRAREAWNRMEEDRKRREAESKARREKLQTRAQSAQAQKTSGGVTREQQNQLRQQASSTLNEIARAGEENAKLAQRVKSGTQTAADQEKARKHRERLAADVKDTLSSENTAYMRRQKSGTQTAEDIAKREDHIKNRKATRLANYSLRAGEKGIKDAASGYLQTMTELTDMTASSKNGTQAKAMKMGIQNDAEQMRKLEEERQRTAEKARKDRERLYQAQKKRQAKWDEDTKNLGRLEKAWYGGIESGAGMATDMAVGAVTGTGQFGSLASMGLRTFGSSTNQAREQGATDREARIYGALQSGKEIGTELMFQGTGLAAEAYSKLGGRRIGLDLAGRASRAFTKGLTGKKADIVDAGIKLIGGTAEENVEELAGWGLDPIIKEFSYGKNVRERYKEVLNQGLPKPANKEQAEAIASYISTDKFETDLVKDFVDGGMSEAEAIKLASVYKEYYTALYSGDEETVDRIAGALSGAETLSKASYSKDELIDTLLATTMLTTVTGAPAAVQTSVMGNQIFDSEEMKQRFGERAAEYVANEVINSSDAKLSVQAEAMKKRLDSGKDLTGTQKFQLIQAYEKKIADTTKRQQASMSVAVRQSSNNNYIQPMAVDESGRFDRSAREDYEYYQVGDETQKKYEANVASAMQAAENIAESDSSISETEKDRMDQIAAAVSGVKDGGLTVGNAHEFAYGNKLAREVLKQETGIDLDQYVVKDSKGNVDYAATAIATEDALFKAAAENYVETARAETEAFIDHKKGEMDLDIMSRLGSAGQAAWKDINKDLDPREMQTYLKTANAASYMYAAGRNSDLDFNAVKNATGNLFSSVDNSALRKAFDSGRTDRTEANTPALGQTVEAGKSMSETSKESIPVGELTIDESIAVSVPDSTQQVYKALAEATGVNIHLVANLDIKDEKGNVIGQANGASQGDTIFLNLNSKAESNLGYVFMHEMTHQIKKYAPAEYTELENLIRDTWFEKDYAGMQRAIKHKIDLYADNNQTLDEAGAMEEIVADAMAEAIDDPTFAFSICSENESLGRAILNSIRSALRSLRNMLANGVSNRDFHGQLLSYLDILHTAESLWIRALSEATKARASQAIDQKQDEMNKGGEVEIKYSINPDYEKQIDNWDEETIGFSFVLGTTSDVLKEIGVKDQQIRLDASNAKYRIGKHDNMDKDVLKQIPSVLEDPIVVMRSKKHDTRLVILGEIYDKANNPVSVVLELKPTKRNKKKNEPTKLNISKIASAQGRSNIQSLINGSLIMYINPEIKKTDSWLNANRLQLPLRNQYYGLINKIAYEGDTVKIVPVGKTFEQLKLESEQLGAIDENKLSISPEQDADYMKAVESGDMETAQRMVDEAAAKAMPNSKILDEDGNLLLVYHGSDADFNEFDRTKSRANMDIQGNFFSPYEIESAGYGENVRKFYLNIENPASESESYAALNRFSGENEAGIKAREYLIEQGYDGVMNYDEFITFDSEQSKSADPVTYDDDGNVIPLSQRFDMQNPDIRYSIADVTLNDGTELSDVVILDNERIIENTKEAREFLYAKAGAKITVASKNGDSEDIYLARKEDKIRIAGSKNKRRVINKLVGTSEETKQSVIANIIEIAENSKYEGASSDNGHGWLDKNGWEYRTAHAIAADGSLWEMTLNIAVGEEKKILYAINRLKKIAEGDSYVSNSTSKYNIPSDTNESKEKISIAETDSEGSELSQGQETFFERSKNRNAEGQLKVMLHGTDADFTEFDPSKARPGTLGRAFYFSDSAAHAGQYGNVGRYYLNLENPLTGNTHDITKDQLRRFVAYLAENEDYGIENYGADATVDSVTDSIWGGTDFAMLRDLNLSAVGDFAEAVKVFNRVNGTDYDGIITDVETAAFYPEQIKRTDNLNPTLSKDTGYSITDANGKDLSDGQVSYFRNSKARDEQGRLVPVYHSTNRGGFTIFDPSYSDDHRSLFFAASKDVSLTYGGLDANRPVDYEGGELQSGYYECYLNLENPMIIDCRGSDWDRIMADGFESLFVSYKNGDFYVESSDEWLTIDDIRDEYGEGFADAAEAWLDNVSTSDAEIGDLIYTYEGRAFDPEVEGYYPDENDTRTWCLEAEAQGYDGVIFLNIKDIGGNSDGIRIKNEITDVYVAFSSNQVKDVNNLNPTENPDIRYSITPEDDALSRIAYAHAMDNSNEALEYYEQLIDRVDPETYNVRPFNEEKVAAFYAALNSDEAVVSADPVEEESRIRMARSKADFYNNLNTKWNDRWHTEGEVLDVKSVKSDIRNLVMGVMSNSDTDRKYRTELVNKMLMDVRTAFQLMKQDRQEVAASLLYHSALRMVESAEFYVDDTYDQYKDLKEYFKTTKISLGEEYWSDVDFGSFRKNNFGRMKLVKGSTNVDQIYMELCEMFPEWFREDETLNVPDQLEQMAHVLDSVQPYKEAYTSEAAAELAFDIADELYDIMVGGKEVKSLADQYKERYDAKTKAMKQRHAEAMLRMRRQRDLGVQAERAKWRAREEARKEKKQHNKYFDRINKNYNKLVKRLFDNTKDSHIPEQYKKELAKLLSAFDLQTVGSKKVQDRRGVWGKNTIKMAATKAALANISNRAQDFKVNDAITDLMDDLLASGIEGKTIDELSITELQKIDDIMKALVHEFNNYEQVVKDNKKQATSVFGNSQVDDCLKHAEIFGPGKDYHGLLGALDKIINLDEQTAAYLFRRIDPNYTGIGAMWKEVRKSFDKYVRNTAQLKEWMEEITGEYHNKGRLNKYGSDVIDSWRSANYAKAFKLANGTVELTPAQMMSIYCLAKRPQAYGHMVGAGIVVRPVSFNAKLMTDLKKKLDTSLPIILTDADIKTITKELTPDQIKVAEKLQELMSTKMAAWGNEASMEVIGIELFHEDNYFPIKSDKAALESDLSADQFVDSVRNFGFAKAVAPGARNAIMVDDIFDVVAEHCNNMNLYNSYSRSMDDFMKVLNYRQFREDGREYTVKQAIGHAYSQKAVTFILQMMRDLNGNVSGGDSGISSMYNRLLGNAKAASVMGNGRVLLQQPTAITRAFAVINPKYIKGIRIDRGVLDEMWEHCPIALWKSWGYYDINMGRPIEDVIMNNGSIADDLLAGSYGVADNITWAALWQMVKAEMKDTHPDVEIGTDEYWELANERMSEIVDFTQVVDSPIHRSHGMRSKNYLEKTATSFMAEPTLTFNMIKDGLIRAYESWKLGDKKAATKILGVTASVFATQAVTVSIAQALWDTLRGKGGDDDDEEEKSKLLMIWQNFLENLGDEVKIWNKVYFIKDIDSLIRGYGFSNMALQGFKMMIDGWNQLTGTRKVFSSKSWYENFFGGFGYITGMPIQTLIRDTKAIYKLFGLNWNVANELGEYLDSLPDVFKGSDEEAEEATFLGKLMNIAGKSGDAKSDKDSAKDKGDGKTSEAFETKEDLLANDRDEETMLKDALKAAGDKEGEERNKKIWSSVSEDYKKYVAAGDYGYIEQMRRVVEEAGGDLNYFDERIKEASKTALKKSISYDGTPEQNLRQYVIRDYLTGHGMTEKEVSEIVYKSDIAKDLKVAFRINDEKAIEETGKVLVRAGLTEADWNKLYENRNRMKIETYDGRYKDRLKSTGNFIWPTEGVITSHFGYRDAPTAGASSNHPAIDIGAASGTDVVAADGGTVIYVGYNGGYGNSVGIKHDNGMVTYYNHLSSYSVNEGDVVSQGQYIAAVGSTGISTGPHLDFKILDTDGNPVDPEEYLDKRD